MNNKLHVKKGDTVRIISGDDRGSKGKVLEVSPKEGKVIVEGKNIVKKHVKPRKMGDPGGIISAEGCDVRFQRLWSSAPTATKETRVGHKKFADGTKRAFAKNAAKRCRR